MEIKTGYFAKIREYEKNNYLPVSIARFKPKWFNGKEAINLAPSDDLLMRYKQGKTDMTGYTEEYMNYLKQNITEQDILNLLPDESEGYNGIVLCCYEKPGDFCHRHLLANYISRHFDIEISEYPSKQQNYNFGNPEDDLVFDL